MLEAREFTVGSLAGAKPLTLVLSRGNARGASFLVGASEGEAVAVFLSGEYQYRAFKTAGNDSWEGILIPDVRIEVDEKSVFDPDIQPAVFGAVICKGSGLTLNAYAENWRGMVWPITLVEGAEAAVRTSVGFSRWNIVLGSGSEKRVLFNVSVGESASAGGD